MLMAIRTGNCFDTPATIAVALMITQDLLSRAALHHTTMVQVLFPAGVP